MTQIIIHENDLFNKVVAHPSGIGTTIGASVPLPKYMIPNENCGLTTAQIAAKDVPSGCKYEIIEVEDFENYWSVGIGSTAMVLHEAVTSYDFDTKVSTFNLVKAKQIAHRKRRNRRYSEFAPHDAVVSTAIPGTATDTAEASRVGIRSTYDTMQTEIDACSTVDEIYAILQKYPSRPIPPEANMNLYQRINDDGSSAELML